MVLNSKQRQIGMDNFADAVKITRRQVLSGAIAVPTVASMYWGYGELKGNAVRAGIIGTGNQGCQAHISQSNPEAIQFVAFSDIRPSQQKRARNLFNEKYGKDSKVKLYENYKEMLADKDIEMVVIALPLHLHAQVAIEAMSAGKHVLCEKLMAKTVEQCKEMVRAADKYQKMLAVGHQRHYSYLYANALSLIEEKLLGDVRTIRAYWHRNQTASGAEGAKEGKFDGWRPEIPAEDANDELAKKYGYENAQQLVQWRLDNRTGGGLMVELGSHQLDAISIFLNKKHPVSVQGVGKVSYFTDGRDVNDHVHLIYEFGEDADNVIAGYTSICTNTFDGYGEQVMGTKGTLIIQSEAEALFFKEPAMKEERVTWADRDTRVSWAEARMDRPTTAASSTKAWGTGTDMANSLTSRGYREEQEHMAWLIRHPDAVKLPSKENPHPSPENCPRCHARVGLGDAVITLASNLAMEKKKKIDFKPEWFDAYSESTPEKEV